MDKANENIEQTAAQDTVNAAPVPENVNEPETAQKSEKANQVSATEKGNRSFFPRLAYYAKAILLAPVALVSAVVRLIQRAALGKEGADKAEKESYRNYKEYENSLDRRAYSKHMTQMLQNLIAEDKTQGEYKLDTIKMYDVSVGKKEYKYGIDVKLDNGVQYTMYADESLNLFNMPTVPDILKMQIQKMIDSSNRVVSGSVREMVEDHDNEINDAYNPDLDPESGSPIAAAMQEAEKNKSEPESKSEPEPEIKPEAEEVKSNEGAETAKVEVGDSDIRVKLMVGGKEIEASRAIGGSAFVVHSNINEIPKESLDSMLAGFQKEFDKADKTPPIAADNGNFINEVYTAIKADMKSETPGNMFCAYGRATFVPEPKDEKITVTRSDKSEYTRSLGIRSDSLDCQRKIAAAYAAVSYAEKVPDKGAIPVSFTVTRNGSPAIQAVLVEKTRQDAYTIQSDGNGAAKIYASENVAASKLGKVAQAFVPSSMKSFLTAKEATQVIRSEMQGYDRPDYLVIGKMVATVAHENATDEKLTLQSTDKRGGKAQSAIITDGFDKDAKLIDPQIDLLLSRMNYVQDKEYTERSADNESRDDDDHEVF